MSVYTQQFQIRQPLRRIGELSLVAALPVLLALGGCASKPVEVPQPVLGNDNASVGAATGPALSEQKQFNFYLDLQHRLSASLEQTPDAPLGLLPRADGFPSVRIDGSAFRGDSGELEASALLPMSNLARVLNNTGPCVVLVLGERVNDGAPEGADIGDRRAASIATSLSGLGFPQARIKASSRVQPGSGGGVILIVKPLVAGHEQEAFVVPPVEA